MILNGLVKGNSEGLASIGMVRRTVTKKGVETVENCYYISSLKSPSEGNVNYLQGSKKPLGCRELSLDARCCI